MKRVCAFVMIAVGFHVRHLRAIGDRRHADQHAIPCRAFLQRTTTLITTTMTKLSSRISATWHLLVCGVITAALVACGDVASITSNGDAIDRASAVVTLPQQPVSVVAASSGFYYPTAFTISNDGNFGACGSEYLTNKRHNGTDIRATRTTPVFSIAYGTLVGTKTSADDWGPGNVAVAIRYESFRGPFVAVFGHITRLTGAKTFKPGDLIGYVGAYQEFGDHLHFGVYPGSSPPSSGWGRVTDTGCRNPSNLGGFVPPVSYIRSNIPKLPAPRNVSATDGAYRDRIEVTWDRVETAISYVVYRAVNSRSSSYSIVGRPSGTRYSDTNVKRGTIYFYKVAASNQGGANTQSDSNSGTVK
jgi:murein DD-endopeptidase MepM/ murein hydrolase activator NlpD